MCLLTLSQCTLAGPVYTGMPPECHWLTHCTLGYHWATQWIFEGYTGTPLENLFGTAQHWIATGETLTVFVCTGTPLEKLSWNCPTLGCHWRNSNFFSHHWMDCNTPPPPFKWQDGGTPTSKWTCFCKFSFDLEFTAPQWIWVLLLKRVSTSTSLHACFWYKHHYSFCVLGVAVQMKLVELKQLSPYQLYT